MPVSAPSHEAADQSRRTEATEPRGKELYAPEGTRSLSRFRVALHRLGYYGLALLLVGAAALLRWALPDVLRPVEFLPFGLAWVGAAVLGGMGPGLLAAVASWVSVELLFDSTPGHVTFGDPVSVTRLLAYLAGGLVVGVVGEGLRRARIHGRLHAQELAAANRALRKSEEKYRFLVEKSKDVTWTIDLQGRWTFISSNVEKVAGYRVDEFVGKTLWDFLAPECHDLVKEKLRRRARGEDLPPYEVLMVGKDGRRMPFELHATAVVDAGGNIVGVQGVSRDLTERKRAEESLRKSEFHLRQAQQIAHLGSWSWDLAADRLYWSDEIYRLYGLQPGESEPRHEDFLSFIHPEDRLRVQQGVKEALARGGAYQLDFRIVPRGGRERYVHCEAQIILDREGHPVKAEGALQDITERKRAEETLRRSEAALRRSQEITRVDNWTLNFETRELDVSDQAFRNYGYKVGAVKPTLALYLSHIHPDDKKIVLEHLEKMQRGELGSADYRIIRPDGSLCVMHSVVDGFTRDVQGRVIGAYGVGQDVTERKQVEQELRELNATLESRVARRTAQLQHRAGQLQKLTLELTEAEERERKRLAGFLHDDLQQVLAAAKLHVNLLSSRVKNDAESHEIAEQAKGLLADAIAKSRSLSHELSAPGLSRSNLREPFEWLAEQIQQKHRFTVHLEMGERIEVASEPLRILLYKAAQELLFNAIKHAGVHEAKLRVRRQRARLQLLVSDAGRGFEFGPSGPALGFGLLSIRERVEYLGGRLKIRSAAGKGSTFLIAVPDTEVAR